MSARAHLGAALALLAAACAAGPATPLVPQPAASEAGRLVQDVEYALAAIEARHPRPFGVHPRSAFLERIEALRGRGGALARDEAFLALMQLVALVGDSHTRLGEWSEIADLELPVHLEWWSDGLWVTAVQADRAELFAARVLRLGGCSAEDLPAALEPWIPHENEVALRQGSAALASLPRALRAAGVATDLTTVRLEIVDREGQERSVELPARRREELGPWAFVAPEGWKPPILLRDSNEPWWWEVLEPGRALYLQYNRCLRRESASFSDTASEVLAELEARPELALIVDLRNNSGGDSQVLEPLLDAVRAGRPGAGTFVLIGPITYSSGMLNAWQLRESCGAVLVGEPCGQKPDSFGELRGLALPNTGWWLDVSTKRFRLFGDDRPTLAPGEPAPTGFADVLAGRDPGLERALELARGAR